MDGEAGVSAPAFRMECGIGRPFARQAAFVLNGKPAGFNRCGRRAALARADEEVESTMKRGEWAAECAAVNGLAEFCGAL